MSKKVTVETTLQRTDLPGSQIDEELVFFNQKTGKYYGTGPIGAQIWNFIESPKSVAEICDHLLEKFDVDRETCENHVVDFASEMIAGGIAEKIK